MASPIAIYLDTNVFIAAYESVGARSDHAWWILEATEAGEFHVITSELTLAELLVRPLGVGNSELCKTYNDVISNGNHVGVIPVTRGILTDSARLRVGRSGLKLPDAVHCATALQNGCRAIISDDTRMPKGLDIPVIAFGPSALSALRKFAP